MRALNVNEYSIQSLFGQSRVGQSFFGQSLFDQCLFCLMLTISAQIAHSGELSGGHMPEGVDSATGFRMERYRSPVPEYIPGGKVLSTEDVLEKTGSATVFIDVYPPKGFGPDPLDGNWMISEKHQFIEGSIWLPEVGRGHLEPDYEAYFRRNLAAATDNNFSVPLLFYCTADCWQSWNAARRAFLWGYTSVYWYPEGIDGWLDSGLPLVPAVPVSFLGR